MSQAEQFASDDSGWEAVLASALIWIPVIHQSWRLPVFYVLICAVRSMPREASVDKTTQVKKSKFIFGSHGNITALMTSPCRNRSSLRQRGVRFEAEKPSPQGHEAEMSAAPTSLSHSVSAPSPWNSSAPKVHYESSSFN